jgi:hypothetical protein
MHSETYLNRATDKTGFGYEEVLQEIPEDAL